MTSSSNRLAEQKAQVALVFQMMLGMAEARAYLIENDFTESNIDRILNGDATRKRSAPMNKRKSITWRGKVTAPRGPLLIVEQRWLERKHRAAKK
ncbi:hypothetical protein [Massilia litorea]|uniref:Uncharacterized protein n=1 Tax=Massilia litorea TaxID=2769491 RepID=A0A7L9UB63_9BURK|nr:hypothetical protein [Massilia litorea]QOL52228.1 hypothetical protein LPB04_23755 [Massilia litorea]